MTVDEKRTELDRLNRPTSPYRRLKLAMDYWCALWFWPIPEAGSLPDRADFLADMAALLIGPQHEFERPPEQLSLMTSLDTPRQSHLAEAALVDVDALTKSNKRLAAAVLAQSITRFHHWELAYAELFQLHGGFDLILGNPPWVKPSFDESGVLSDFDPTIALRKMSATKVGELRKSMFSSEYVSTSYLNEFSQQSGNKEFLGVVTNYPLTVGKANLYKCFITRSWELGTKDGVIGLLHPEGVYDDPRGGDLRLELFRRVVHHFHFINELTLFAEVDHHTQYSVNIYRANYRGRIMFTNIANLFHPSTIDSCYQHDGNGIIPGIRDDTYKWEVRGHQDRISRIESTELKLFSSLYESSQVSALEARLPVIHSIQVINILEKFALQKRRLSDLSDHFYSAPTTFWNETTAQQDETIMREVRYPTELREWILSGPHFHVATPFNKSPNEGCKSNLDYSDIDLSKIDDDFFPRTIYVPACFPTEYLRRTPTWKNKPLTAYYRQLYRAMLAVTGERTLIGCIAPKEVAHIHGVRSFAFDDLSILLDLSSLSSSIVYDFFVRSTGKQNLHELATLLPMPELPDILKNALHSRVLRLNSLTTAYAMLWKENFKPEFQFESWSKFDNRLSSWGENMKQVWHRDVALRTPFERRQGLIEIDVLSALALNLTLNELLTLYRVQFTVLQKYERQMFFDQRGMQVPVKTVSGQLGFDESHPNFPSMVPPFTPVDREADYRQAWAHFEKRLAAEKDATTA